MTAALALEPAMAVDLTRHPASDGAHRLAWWLSQDDARWDLLAAATGAVGLTDRLLSGEVEPIDTIALAIAVATDGAVLPEDWMRGGPLGWLDRPLPRGGHQA